MATMTIHISDDKHERLKRLATSQGISVDKLIDEFSTQAISEFDAHDRFLMYAAQGDAKHGLKTLDGLTSILLLDPGIYEIIQV